MSAASEHALAEMRSLADGDWLRIEGEPRNGPGATVEVERGARDAWSRLAPAGPACTGTLFPRVPRRLPTLTIGPYRGLPVGGLACHGDVPTCPLQKACAAGTFALPMGSLTYVLLSTDSVSPNQPGFARMVQNVNRQGL